MIRDKHVFKEIVHPDQVEKMEEPNMLGLIYKAVYMCVRLLVDIRRYSVPKEVYLGFDKKQKDGKKRKEE